MPNRRTSTRRASGQRVGIAHRAVPGRRTLVLLETGLLVGLVQGILWNLITGLHVAVYLKSLLLMIGVVGLFALAARILEPIIAGSLKIVASLDSGSGVLVRIGLHSIVLFLIFVGYLHTFFRIQ